MDDSSKAVLIAAIITAAIFVGIHYLTKTPETYSGREFKDTAAVVCGEDGVSYSRVESKNGIEITIMLENGPNGLQLKRCTPNPND